MDTIKIDKKNTLMVAHRGASGLEKENTMAAFIAAGNRSYYGVETDVHRTLDGKYVIIHDDTTARVCIDDMTVEKTTFECLRGLQILDVDGTRGRIDLRIPTLEEYINICKKYEKICVLELKGPFAKQDILEIVALIEKAEYLDQVIFISFHMQNLVYLKEDYPNAQAQFLTSKYTEALIEQLLKYNLDLDIHYPQLTQERIATLHANGIKVNCWTVDDPLVGQNLVDWGVDFITSNILE